jgi:hypothetical protein
MTKVPTPYRHGLSDPAVLGAMEKLKKLIDEDRKAQIQVAKPAPGASLVSPIDMEATWTRPIRSGTFAASINGRDVTSLFSVDEKAMKATAKGARVADPGCDSSNPLQNMTLVVSANMAKNLPKPGDYRIEASSSFTLAGPTYAMALNANEINGAAPQPHHTPVYQLDVLRGSSALVRVTIIPVNGFACDVEITALASQPPATPLGGPFISGVKFNAPLVIAAGDDYGFLRIDVEPALACGDYAVAVVGTTVDDFGYCASQFALVNLTVHDLA